MDNNKNTNKTNAQQKTTAQWTIIKTKCTTKNKHKTTAQLSINKKTAQKKRKQEQEKNNCTVANIKQQKQN